jgi:outer membrane protein TolC
MKKNFNMKNNWSHFMNLRKQKTGGLKYLFCLAAAMLLCTNLPAQEEAQRTAIQPLQLSSDEAVERAIKNNLGLESSRTSAATKKRASDLSWNQFIPNITLGNSLIRDNEASKITGFFPVDISTIPGLPISIPPETLYGVTPYSIDAPQWHIAVSLQTSLTLNFAMIENMRRLKLDYEGGLLSYDKAKAQLERDVRKAYHNLLLLHENITLLKGSLVNLDRQVQMARDNYNAGLVPELSLLQAQVARETLRPVIDQTENSLKLLMAQFAMFLNISYDTPFELMPIEAEINFIPLDIAEMISKASSGKPDILELKHSILMLESVRKLQVHSLTPSLSLSWNYLPAFIKDPWNDSWFNGKNWTDRGSLTISVGVRLHSLIPFSVDFQGIKNIDDQITTANIGLAQMIRGTEIEIYNTVLSLEKTRISAEVQAKTVDLAEQSYRLTEEAYSAGLQDLFQVQNSEQSLRQARVQMLEQQFNYINGLIDLEYSIGVPFGTLSKRSR